MEQLEQMRLGTDCIFTVNLRGYSISLRPLSIKEFVNVSTEVAGQMKSMPLNRQNAIVEHVIFSQKVLQLASTSAPNKSDYKLTEMILENCTPDELSYLFKEYNAGCDKVNPSIERMPIEQVNELVLQAKKNTSTLTELSFWQLENVCQVLMQMIALQDK